MINFSTNGHGMESRQEQKCPWFGEKIQSGEFGQKTENALRLHATHLIIRSFTHTNRHEN